MPSNGCFVPANPVQNTLNRPDGVSRVSVSKPDIGYRQEPGTFTAVIITSCIRGAIGESSVASRRLQVVGRKSQVVSRKSPNRQIPYSTVWQVSHSWPIAFPSFVLWLSS